MGSSFSEVSTTDVFSIEVGFDPDGPGPHGTVDSIKVVNTTDKTATMDGWGDAITPMGTFPSIRQNEVTTETDTVFMLVGGSWLLLSPEMETLLGFSAVEVSTDYRMAWWSNDPSARFPVMEMSHDNAGTVYNVTWLKEAPSADVVEWDAITNLEVYPNPATTNINFNVVSENGGIVVVRDLTGAKVATSALDQSGTTLSVENFNNGMYFYTVILSNGSIAKNGKFVVKK
jgi:hypothetical protein